MSNKRDKYKKSSLAYRLQVAGRRLAQASADNAFKGAAHPEDMKSIESAMNLAKQEFMSLVDEVRQLEKGHMK